MHTELRIGRLVNGIKSGTVVFVSDTTNSPPQPLPEMAAAGRSFSGERKVRLGDVERSGRLRFDALTRYTQDVSDDDTSDAELPESPGWVVRSTVVDQLVPASLGEQLKFVTFCSGLGRRWAERRLSIRGDRGAHYEVATLWVCVDPETGQPRSLTEQFVDLYGQAADGRKVSARLKNPKLADSDGPDLCWDSWQLRRSDYDIYDHVNNAAYWSLVEQWLSPQALAEPLRARLEYGSGLAPAETVTTARVLGPEGLRLWWLEPDDVESGRGAPGEATGGSYGSKDAPTVASVATELLPPDLYRG